MKCPICKTELDTFEKCNTCGFADLRTEFLSKEEANEWLQNVAIPYRESYDSNNIIQPINWLEVFKKSPKAKQLFEVSIPVAIKKMEVLGHIAIVSSSDIAVNHFINVLKDLYINILEVDYKWTSSADIERQGDLAAILTSISDGGVLSFEITSMLKKDFSKLLNKALSDFSLDITIGKGPSARKIRMDLPPFTTIFIVNSISDIPTDIADLLENIIEINPSEDELLEYQIREATERYDVQLTQSTLTLLKEHLNLVDVKRTIKYISDYLFLNSEIKQPISMNKMKEIIDHII